MSVLLNLGGLMLIHFIGRLDHPDDALAAYTICYSQLFAWVTWPSWALRNAASTIMGQNMGAGRLARGKSGVHVAAVCGVGWAAAMGIIYWCFIGGGDTKKPMYIAFITQIVLVLGLCVLFAARGWLTAQAMWSFILVGHVARFALSAFAFHHGQYDRIKVELGS